ncbi:MAG: T9SS type A sorting domain-containing protein, partial [Saprospiraceae bacterium]|nr:T9SS type A sorting domain-containing protein [Saprospiraceae bacterium]
FNNSTIQQININLLLYMKKSLHLLFTLSLISSFCTAQIYTLDFDANNTGYTSGPDGFANEGESSDDYYDITSTGFAGTYIGGDGNFFAAQDIDGLTGFSATQIFEMNGIDITNFTNLTFALDIAEDDDIGWDASDVFLIEYRLGAGAYSPLFEIGVESGSNQTPDIRFSTNAADIGTVLTDAFTNYTGPISGTGSSLDIRITITLGSDMEDIAFDNFIINGDNTSGVPGITLTSPAGSTSETGTTTTFTAVLKTEPTSDVVLDVSSANTAENTVSPATLTFSTLDWDSPQTITVTGVDDALLDGDQTTTISVTSNNAMTSDMDYQDLLESVDVTNLDDEVITNNDVRINELDADQDGTDFAEFIELFGTPNLSLTGLVVVLYNGSNDAVYETYDLDGFSLDANGFFLIGASGVTGASGLVPFTPDVEIKNTGIQNGTDAVALYSGNSSDFPNGTGVTTVGLIDALVYNTNEAFDPELAELYNDPTIFDPDEMVQVNEDELNNAEFNSIQRGSWFVSFPTPRSMNALPVELTYLAVDRDEKGNRIMWTTESEVNNNYFEILRSNNGSNFQPIGRVNGNINSTKEINYSFIDENPTIGRNYYKLKQVDLDGSFEYSYIVQIENKAEKVAIYPTIATNHITVEIKDTESAKLSIVNNAGQTLKVVSLTSALTTVDISELPVGVYYAKVQSNTQYQVERIVKN